MIEWESDGNFVLSRSKKTVSLTSVTQELRSRVGSSNLECFPPRTVLCFHKGL